MFKIVEIVNLCNNSGYNSLPTHQNVVFKKMRSVGVCQLPAGFGCRPLKISVGGKNRPKF